MTRVLAGSLQTPVVAPVSIGVCSYTAGASVGGPRLPPHPVVVPGVLVAVRVHAGHDKNVVFVQDVAVSSRVLRQLLHDVGGCGWADPLSCVNTTWERRMSNNNNNLHYEQTTDRLSRLLSSARCLDQS